MTLEESYKILSDEELYDYIVEPHPPRDIKWEEYKEKYKKLVNFNQYLAYKRYESIQYLHCYISKSEILSMTTEERLTYIHLELM